MVSSTDIFTLKFWSQGGIMKCEYKISWIQTSWIPPYLQDLFSKYPWIPQKFQNKINEIQVTKIKKYARSLLKSCFGDILNKNVAIRKRWFKRLKYCIYHVDLHCLFYLSPRGFQNISNKYEFLTKYTKRPCYLWGFHLC